MPEQETFLKEHAGSSTIEVIKTFDPSYAREVFRTMDEEAKAALAEVLRLNNKYLPADIPGIHEAAFDDFLWDELSESSLEDVREYPRKYSFFIVRVSEAGKAEDRFVSADWPSAEAFARGCLAGSH